MSNGRADLGFGAELESFDPNEWEQKPKPKPKATASAATKAAAEAAGFKSRESAPKPARKPQRRHTTGRNQQINIKAKGETIEAFYAIAGANGWRIAEAFEHAVELMEKTYSK
jgi:hypothetical protein